jgi:hypothetical protein
MKKLSLLVVAVLGIALLATFSASADDAAPSIKDVMKKCMKGGLCKKVADGDASDEEKAELVVMFTAMSKAKPPKGEADSWKEKTAALVKAATAAKAGDEGAGAALKKAANCMACHKAHKG